MDPTFTFIFSLSLSLWSPGVNGVFHHNEGQEHVETSHSTGQGAQLQGKQATDKNGNSNVRHTVNLVSSTDQFSMFNFILGTNNIHLLYVLSQGPALLWHLFGSYYLVLNRNKKFEVDQSSSLVGFSCLSIVLS